MEANGLLSKRRQVAIFGQKMRPGSRVLSTDCEAYAGMEIRDFGAEIPNLHTRIRFAMGGLQPAARAQKMSENPHISPLVEAPVCLSVVPGPREIRYLLARFVPVAVHPVPRPQKCLLFAEIVRHLRRRSLDVAKKVALQRAGLVAPLGHQADGVMLAEGCEPQGLTCKLVIVAGQAGVTLVSATALTLIKTFGRNSFAAGDYHA